ncbi:integrin alpha-E [Trichomycterus rosablanca]|uniref:integrin alpha-E n=1 Tax=Trichomycterus rosablanca TaxID=2290929 RepID=UPI002F351472
MMLAAVLLLTGIYSTLEFNIYPKPEYNYSSADLLFGQTIIQTRDGVLVLSPSKGDVFRCTMKSCSNMNDKEGVGKYVRPVSSATSSINEDKEQLLVCGQVRTLNSSTEYLNADCVHMSNQEKYIIYPAKLQQNNSNNNPGITTHLNQDHWRMKRDAGSANTDEEEEEDAGTEIAFVLDGSGSIDEEDFERAKDFIINVTTKVWTTCFSCNFGIVQFGRKIRTELSLEENNDTARALEKIKSIEQIGEITITASALHHVLTDIFVPENGSKKNAKKMIILLSDGQMSGDKRTLPEVLEMPEMKGIVRYAIGVGPEIVKRTEAIDEMIEISGSGDRFFNVSNYAGLENIISSLEQSIVGIEGIQKGAGFQFELAEAGFSSHLTHDGSMLFGAVGAYDWSGGIILKQKDKETVAFLNATSEEPRFSYLGYSVASAHVGANTLYISGAPRYNLTGAVYIFDGNKQDLLKGDQVGSYFGSVLCALDIDNNKETDYLLVGAPHFHEKGEEGKVLVYKLHQGKFELQKYELRHLEKYIYARFGSAIADIGDIDGDGFRDIAVGAPLEEADDLPGSSGSVYVFNTVGTTISQQFSQRISPSDFREKLVHFGQAVSAMSASNNDKAKLICVGSEGAITTFKTLSVIIINPQFKKIDDEPIPLNMQTDKKSVPLNKNFQICFNTDRGRLISDDELPIQYDIDLDYGKEIKRFSFVNPHERNTFTLTESLACTDVIKIKYEGCTDCFSPIKIRVNFTLAPTSGIPLRVLDLYSSREAIKEILFEKDCKDKENCTAKISLANFTLSNDLILMGSSQTLNLRFDFTNKGYSSYMTTLILTYPAILNTKKAEGFCEVNKDENQIICKLLHPVFKRNELISVEAAWQSKGSKSDLGNAAITAVLIGGNNGTEELGSKSFPFKVKNPLKVLLSGTAHPTRLTIGEGKEHTGKQELKFTFKLLGENKYMDKLNVTIRIIKNTTKTDVRIVKVQPENCTYPSNTEVMSIFEIVCTLTNLQDINVIADTDIHDIENKDEKITAIGELSFNETIFDGTGITKTDKVVVLLEKLKVKTNYGYIIGSAIGGFLLLIIIIIILVKCGFFSRRQHMDRTRSSH